MPHLAETYSRTTGLRIDKMLTYEQFFPLPMGFDDYILVCSGSGMGGKNYSYFPEVLWLIREGLQEKRLKIIQVGEKNDEKVGADLDICGGTSIHQFYYLVKHARLVLCNDTSLLHLAGHYNKPLVTLFGLTDPKISGAYFGDPSKQVYLTPEYKDRSPSFNPNEHPKIINEIRPEEIAKSIGELLDFESKLIHTVCIGEQYRFRAIEVVPDHLLSPNFFPSNALNLRYDYGGNEGVVFSYLGQRKCNLVTNKPINVDSLVQLRQGVGNVVYEINEDHNPKFVEKLHRSGIPYILITYLPPEELQKIKLDYYEFNLIHPKTRKTRDEIPNIDEVSDSTEFRSNKFLLSKGKIYLSKAHWLADLSLPNFEQNHTTVLDNEIFWREAEFFYLFNRIVLPS